MRQDQAHYQSNLQANAARATQELRGSQTENQVSKSEWQTLIAVATRALITAGTEYSQAFSEVKRYEKILSSLKKRIDTVMAEKEAREPLLVSLVTRWHLAIVEVDVITRTIYEVEE